MSAKQMWDEFVQFVTVQHPVAAKITLAAILGFILGVIVG